MKWSDFTYDDFYIPYDENQRAIRGFLLTTLGVDLNNIPTILQERFEYIPEDRAEKNLIEKKVILSDIIGSSYHDYSDMSIIESFMRIKRGDAYIQQGAVTRGKYFHMLKQHCAQQRSPIILSENKESNYYWVDGNGNHRVVMYKIMMLAEIASKYEWARSESYDISFKGFEDIRRKYWLRAYVREH